MLDASTRKTRTQRSQQTALAIFAAALAVRLMFCFVAVPVLNLKTGPSQADFYDSTDGYINIAANLVENGRFAFSADAPPTTYRAPVFPFAVAIVYAIIGNLGTAVLITNCIASALTCVVVLWIGRALVGDRAGFLLATPAILFPLSIYYCASSFSDTFVALTVSLYALALLKLFQTSTRGGSMKCGLAFALAALTKAVVVPIPVLICAYAAARRRAALRPAVASMLIGFAVVGLWTARNYQATGRFVLITGGSGYNALIGNFMIDESADCDTSLAYGRARAREYIDEHAGRSIETADLRPTGFLDIPPDIDRLYGRSAARMMYDSPGLLFRKLAVNALRFWYFSSGPTKSLANAIVNGLVLLFALAGAAALLRERRMELEVLGLIVVAFVVLYSLIIVHSSRFCLPMVMVLLPMAAWGALRVLGLFRAPAVCVTADRQI